MFYIMSSGLSILTYILIIILTSVFFILYPADQREPGTLTELSKWPGEITDSIYGRIAIDSFEVSTQNTIKLFGWAYNYSIPRSDKSIGIWPRGFRRLNPKRLKELTEKWGFTYLCYSVGNMPDWKNFQDAGFDLKKTMMEVSDQTIAQRKEAIKLFNDAFAFYVDEPYGQSTDYPDRSVDSLKECVDVYSKNSLTITSGYKRNAVLKSAADKSDKVLYSDYKHWRKFPWPSIWTSWPVDKDQRPDWTDMKNTYKEKFTMTWIGAHRDFEEYDILFEHAKKLDLDIIWYYQLDDSSDDQSDNNIRSFCYNASMKGYLKGFERYYCIEYQCINDSDANPHNCDPGNPEHWRINKIYPLNKSRLMKEE